MILEQLTLRNFCLFRGRQVFELSPRQRQGKLRPIVLFGGINGGGKTTLFDAIQLALYGSRARCSKRTNRPYEEFLRESIHHGIAPDEGAGVWLSFRHAAEGEEHAYEVRRDWSSQGGKLREDLHVYQDGLLNYSLSRNWPQLVEELIPLEISQLFFFDGEKIRTLAEDASSSEALGAAIKALLGLDIVERLITDATVLQARLAKQTGTPEQRAQAEALEQEYRACKTRVEDLHTERSALENRLQRARTELHEAEAVFAAAGGNHWTARQAREQRRDELTIQAQEVETELIALAAGDLPLALVPELLDRIVGQDGREHQAAEAEVVQRLLAERDRQLLEVLHAAQVPPRLLKLVSEHLQADRDSRQPAQPMPRRLELSEGARSLLRQLREHKLADLCTHAQQLLDKLAQLGREREDLARDLAVTPNETDVRQLVDRFKTATQHLTMLEEEAKRLDAALKGQRAELQACEARLRQVWQGHVEKEFEREDLAHMVDLAGRTREAMQEFLRRATEQKIDRLSALITESFRYLLRKQTLVERILIDPATFGITLYDGSGQALARQRLSEGEKQIFAIAMLWGLARASARPLPAVIDTPMARLDAAHRRHLVERYFPNASHQVVIFSTDTEVDRHYYQLLQPAIARAYHLKYDEESKRTVGEEGYFWKEE